MNNDIVGKIINKVISNLQDFDVSYGFSFGPETTLIVITPRKEDSKTSVFSAFLNGANRHTVMISRINEGEYSSPKYYMCSQYGGWRVEDHPQLQEFFDILDEELQRKRKEQDELERKEFLNFWDK